VVSLLLRDEFHSTLFQIGLVASLAAGFEIPLFFLLPIVAERRGRAFVFKIGCLVGLLYCVGLSASQNYLQVLLLQALNAVFVASVIGMGLAWFQEIHPAKIGFMTGLFSNASRLSALAAAPVIGMSTLYFASYRGPILVAAIMVLAGGLILLPIAAETKPNAR
jgi:SET family sugar efflux transporter-like MFS transporter